MTPAAIAAWSAAAPYLSSVAGGVLDVFSGKSARGFEERMSSTAYQRAVKDMRRAGLNPAMMFGSGSAASTPSVPPILVGRGLSEGVSSAQRLRAELQLLDAQTEQVKAATAGEKQRQGLVRITAEPQLQKLGAEGESELVRRSLLEQEKELKGRFSARELQRLEGGKFEERQYRLLNSFFDALESGEGWEALKKAGLSAGASGMKWILEAIKEAIGLGSAKDFKSQWEWLSGGR